MDATYKHANEFRCRLMQENEMWHYRASSNGLPHEPFCKTLTFRDLISCEGRIHFMCRSDPDCDVTFSHPREDCLKEMISRYEFNGQNKS